MQNDKSKKKRDNANVQCFYGPSETAAPVLKLYCQRTKIQPAAGDGGSSTKGVLPENENPAGGDGGSSTRVVLQENQNPAGRRRRRFQCSRRTTRERKSSRPPEPAVPVLKLYHQRTKLQPAAGDQVFMEPHLSNIDMLCACVYM